MFKKMNIGLFFVLSLGLCLPVYSHTSSLEYSNKCQEILNKVGLSIEDTTDSDKMAELKKHYKGTAVWKELQASCVNDSLGQSTQGKDCPCKGYSKKCGVFFTSCWYNCDACGL